MLVIESLSGPLHKVSARSGGCVARPLVKSFLMYGSYEHTNRGDTLNPNPGVAEEKRDEKHKWVVSAAYLVDQWMHRPALYLEAEGHGHASDQSRFP